MTSFNPRAREGRDCATLIINAIGSVSIHAPARGATKEYDESIADDIVSIHAPARGATSNTQLSLF